MRFVISGYYGFGNAGDEAVLAAMLGGLRRHFPGVDLCVLSADPAGTQRLHDAPAVQRWSAGEVWRALREATVLLQGGGGLLQDRTSWRSPLYYLGLLRMARLRGVRSMVFAQGVGPLSRAPLRWLAGRELRRCAAITVRDPQSVEFVTSVAGGTPPPVLVADPALLLAPTPGVVDDQLRQAGADPGVPRVLLVLRQWPGVEPAVEAYRELVVHLAERRGLEVVVVPFQEPDDREASRAVAAAHPRAHLLAGLTTPSDLVAQVAAASLVVSMRLHGIIFAASQAVPAVGVSYDPKLGAFAAQAGQPVIGLADCTAPRLVEVAEEALTNAPARAEERKTIAQELVESVKRNVTALSAVRRASSYVKSISCCPGATSWWAASTLMPNASSAFTMSWRTSCARSVLKSK